MESGISCSSRCSWKESFRICRVRRLRRIISETGNGKLVWRDFRLQYADLGDFCSADSKKRCTFQRTDVVLLRFPCSSACDWLCGCKRRGNFDPLWLRRVLWHLFGGGCGSAWGSESGAAEKVYGLYVAWLKAAIFFQAAVLFLILVNKDGSINLQTGNPALYETIRAALRF